MAVGKYNLKYHVPAVALNSDIVEVPHLVVEAKNSAQSWGGGGTSTTKTVTDTKVKSDSVIILMPTGSVPKLGEWRITTRTADTSFVITSTDAEQAGLTFEYLIL